MDTRDDRPIDRDLDTHHTDVDSPESGEILGISRVTPGPTGEIKRAPRKGEHATGIEDEDRITPLEDVVDLGARDVTEDGRGQTGPETGGHGSTPQRSGATGSDIGS